MYPAAVRKWDDVPFPLITEIRAAFPGPDTSPERTSRTEATFKYIFTTTKRGSFVMIRGGAVRLYVQVDSSEFHNAWSKNITGAPIGRPTRPSDSGAHQSRFELLDDPSRWFANGGSIVDTWDVIGDGLSGVSALAASEFIGVVFGVYGKRVSVVPETSIKYFNMLTVLCRERRIPDCEFFVNDRDGPLLRKDRREPYSFAWPPGAEIPLVRYAARHYTPIVSYFTDPDIWEDKPGITLEEWEAGDLSSGAAMPWAHKKDVLLWRGASTGFGVTPETNQRLRLAKQRDVVGGIDVGIVSWNMRERILPNASGELCLTMPDVRYLMDLGIKREDRVEAPAHVTYKYTVYVDGHCAAARYPAMMRLGTVIFKVTSVCNAGHLWFFPKLRGVRIAGFSDRRAIPPISDEEAAEADHVVIDADYSNLKATLAWCRWNIRIAEAIARNAVDRTPDRGNRLDYMESLLTGFGLVTCAESGSLDMGMVSCDSIGCGNVALDAEMART